MKLNSEAYEYIKRAVANMYEDYGIHEIPLAPFELANKMGISIIPYSSLDKKAKAEALRYSPDGFSVETIDNTWLIYYNDDSLDIPRIHQTIMHEIGHYILGHTKEGKVEEAEAKFFAKYALAPTPLIHTLIEEKSVENIMATFKIGFQAASIAKENYDKWLHYGPSSYTDYEQKILMQFGIEVE